MKISGRCKAIIHDFYQHTFFTKTAEPVFVCLNILFCIWLWNMLFADDFATQKTTKNKYCTNGSSSRILKSFFVFQTWNNNKIYTELSTWQRKLISNEEQNSTFFSFCVPKVLHLSCDLQYVTIWCGLPWKLCCLRFSTGVHVRDHSFFHKIYADWKYCN